MNHFKLTQKALLAYAVAFGLYVQNLGHFPESPRQWGVAIGGFILSTLQPERTETAVKEAQESQP